MATGINVQKMNSLKVSLLDNIESINALYNRFENCCYNVGQNISGAGSATIIRLLKDIEGQFSIVASNINTYISDMNKVQQAYFEQEQELNSKITSDITIVESMKGD